MENFINGFPGHEHQFRAELEGVLGKEKSEYFFDKVTIFSNVNAEISDQLTLQFLEYWFTEDDAKLYASFGFNSIRLPVSYPSGPD